MKAVTLVGRGPSWTDCQFRTEEVWGTVTCLVAEGLQDKPFTKVFSFDKDHGAGNSHDAIIVANERKIPIVSLYPYATETFPMVEILREFGSAYLMPAMSYMMALALFMGYERLYIHGVDQGPQWMYQFGKPHICHWWGIALGRGVDVRFGAGSLKWSYDTGLDTMPRAFLETEYNPESIDALFEHRVIHRV